MQDTYKHKGMRKKLVDVVRSKGIKDERILDAIGKIPRHQFLDSSFDKFAYRDEAFPIGSGQTLSQPYTVAFQSELLEIKKRDKVLEVGTGSGYQACVLVWCTLVDNFGFVAVLAVILYCENSLCAYCGF